MSPILYVEDEEDDLLLLQLAFKRAGMSHPLKALPNGQQAIDYLAGHGSFADREQHPLPCLVLLDLNLPLKSGTEVLQWIRAQPQFRSMPVLIYTSSDQRIDLERTRELGANDYYVKPSLHHQLVGLVRGIKERWLNELSSGRELGRIASRNGWNFPRA